MRVLVDSNIISRIAQPTHHQHQKALESVKRLIARRDDPCVVPQVIYEFWVVATRPGSSNGLAMSVAEVRDEIAKTRTVFTFLRDERAIFEHWATLVGDLEIKGKNAHDARLAAAARRHAVPALLTFNADDFKRFEHLTIITPDMVLEGK